MRSINIPNMEQLDNLTRIGQLQQEPFDEGEFEGLLQSARTRLEDIKLEGLSKESRFTLAYGAAHSLSLAALRWHGYRSSNRTLVFQTLPHTLGIAAEDWRLLDECHRRRNLAEYEGELDIENALLESLVQVTQKLLLLVEALGHSAQ